LGAIEAQRFSVGETSARYPSGWSARLARCGLGLGAIEAQRFSVGETSARYPSGWSARLARCGLGFGAIEAQRFSVGETSARYPSGWSARLAHREAYFLSMPNCSFSQPLLLGACATYATARKHGRAIFIQHDQKDTIIFRHWSICQCRKITCPFFVLGCECCT
jgi:hypothetical protein